MSETILLSELLSGICQIDPLTDRVILGISDDSRQIKPGYLFIADKGENYDGRNYISQAIAQGAIAIVAEQENFNFSVIPQEIVMITISNLQQYISNIAAKFYAQPSQKLNIIGVTGTNGKTSICYFLARALHSAAYIGTLGFGVNNQLHTALNTTPGAIALQSILNKFYQDGIKYVCMEVSSHGLQQNRVRAVNFKHAIFTNLTQDHLDYHHTMEEYFAAKKKLFEQPGLQNAIINLDDVWSQKIIKDLPDKIPKYTYSVRQAKADVYTENVNLAIDGIHATVVTPWGRGEIQSQVVGLFNLSNLLAVLTVLCLEGHSLASALGLIKNLTGVPGRMQIIKSNAKPIFIVDYSHTPDALQQALVTLRELKPRQLFCVFGCGGERDHKKRPIMGKIAEQLADRIIITNDNPRHEDPARIIDEILSGMSCVQKYQVEMSREKAIQTAFTAANQQDVILIAGKGHEDYQIIGDVKYHFSDEEVCYKLLEEV